MLPSSTDEGTTMPMGRGSVMLPYLPAFCNFYLHHCGRRWHCLMAPPAPPQVPSCFVRPQRLRMRDATTTARAVRSASARYGASSPAWQQAPTRWCSLGCWSAWYPLLLGALGLSQDAAAGDQGVWCGAKPPCTLGRNPLVPWGEI